MADLAVHDQPIWVFTIAGIRTGTTLFLRCLTTVAPAASKPGPGRSSELPPGAPPAPLGEEAIERLARARSHRRGGERTHPSVLPAVAGRGVQEVVARIIGGRG